MLYDMTLAFDILHGTGFKPVTPRPPCGCDRPDMKPDHPRMAGCALYLGEHGVGRVFKVDERISCLCQQRRDPYGLWFTYAEFEAHMQEVGQ